MFSSLLPNVSANMKFTQNGPGGGKPSNRFSVRVFKTGSNAPLPFPYPLSTTLKPDLTYRAAPPPPPPPSSQPLQQHNANWYNNTSYNAYEQHPPQSQQLPQSQPPRPRTGGSGNGGGGFAIYPSATGDTFIYEQSSCSKSDILSLSEPDSPTSTDTLTPSSFFFSPALSSDSTLTLATELDGDGGEPAALDQQQNRERPPPSSSGSGSAAGSGPSLVPVARAPSRSGFAAAPQGPPPAAAPLPTSNSLNRTASLSLSHHHLQHQHHMHEAHAQGESIEEQQLRGRQASLPGRSTTPFRGPGSGPSAPVGGAVVPLPVSMPMPPPQAPGAASMARVPSMGGGGGGGGGGMGVGIPMPIGGGMSIGPDGIIQVPEYEPSTFSEMEVLERDRIAKINAEYNAAESAASAAAYFAVGSMPGAEAAAAMNMRPMSTSPTPRGGPVPMPMPIPMTIPMSAPQTSPTSGREYLARVASSQPPPLMHDSPPRVERLPSGSAPNYPLPPPQQQQHPAAARPRTPSPRQQQIPATSDHQERNRERDRDRGRDRDRSPPNDGRPRRPSLAGPRPDLSGMRQSSDVREYGLSPTEYRQSDYAPPRASSDPSSSATRDRDRDRDRSRDWDRERERERERERDRDREYGYGRDRREVSPNTSPRHLSRNTTSNGLDIRRDSRTSEDYRPSGPSRRNSGYVSDAPISPKDGRGQYKSGPLSSSPTQMRPVPDPSSDNERPYESSRTRSNSFSTSSRPPLPIQTPASDSRYTSEHERSRRSGDRPKEEPRRPSRAEAERSGSDYFSSTHTNYSQTSTIPLPTSYEGHHSHHQPLPSSSSSSHQHAHSRPSAAHEAIPGSRSSAHVYHSDGERPYPPPTTNHNHHSSHLPTSSYDRRPNPNPTPPSSSTAKYADPSPIGREGPTTRSGTPSGPGSEPTQRRYSDGDQKPPVKNQISGKTSTPALRCVRWNENLVCPSPIFAHQRRKGWFNRRGDQLWTNDGQYKTAPAGQEYPPDLADYPEEGEGWMNEEGVRIDLNHRLVPKPPLRSALKQRI